MVLEVDMKVRIKTLEQARKAYPSDYTCKNRIAMPFGYDPDTMGKWLGKIVTIHSIADSWRGIGTMIKLKEDEQIWVWHKDIFTSLNKSISFKAIYNKSSHE